MIGDLPPVKQKKCKVCKQHFPVFNSLAKVCGPTCALKLVRIAKEKELRRKKTEFRRSNRPTSFWIAEAQKAVNLFIRKRDEHLPCISCGARTSPQWDAGHYRSRGAASHLRFNVFNIHKQCVKCNRYGGGNYSEYRKGLIKKIGVERVEKLESDNSPRKMDREYCERVRKIFNKRIKQLEKSK